jgi:hypothetical protein
VSPEQRIRFWEEHLGSFLEPSAGLTDEQRSFVAETIPVLAEVFMSPREEGQAKIRPVEERARQLFTKQQGGAIFAKLSSRTMAKTNDLSAKQRDSLLKTLKARFEGHMNRHPGIQWTTVQTRLESRGDKLWSLNEMEQSGGEPDVVGVEKNGEHIFVDCSSQSPKGRRSVCYDRAALDARKEHKPKDSAVDMATRWGAELVTEDEYRALQALEPFDTTTSSWVKTPAKIRELGGAIFCDRRYDMVFLYHNGAESYYAARGFRCVLRV